MKHLHHTVLSFALSAIALSACAQTAPATSHDQHHPAPAATDTKAASAPDPMAAMDKQIQAMQQMHEKMMKAKTPEERQTLMAEHQKLMQDSMAMMNKMRGDGKSAGMGGMGGMDDMSSMMGSEGKPGGMCGGSSGKAGGGCCGGGGCGMKGGAMDPKMMEKHMEMMKSMMQMMMDRMGSTTNMPTK